MALDEWNHRPLLESAELKVVSATNERIVLAWETQYQGERARSGDFEINPQLPGCADVRVFVQQTGYETRLLEQQEESAADVDPDAIPGDCDVIVLVTVASKDVVLKASNARSGVGHARIDSPRRDLWLAVVPLAAAADTIIVVPLYAAGVAVVLGLSGLASGAAGTSWTWTP